MTNMSKGSEVEGTGSGHSWKEVLSQTWRVVQDRSWHPVEAATYKLALGKLFAVESISVSPQTSPQLFYSEPRPAPDGGGCQPG